MQLERLPCPICKLDEQKVAISDYGERLSVECPRCGKYMITGTAKSVAERKDLEAKLSAWIRDRTEAGTEQPEINSNTLTEIEKILPDYNASQKQLLLLRSIERKTKFPGQKVDVVTNFDYPLAWAANEEELVYYLRALIERGLISRVGGPSDLSDSWAFQVQITPTGWTFLDEHSKPSVFSNQAFVAMSFAQELKPIWENAIGPAIQKAGFKPFRVDAEPHIDRIDRKIITEIKNSRFIVADVTHQRAGVYFEAGYALGLGLPVIWLVRDDDLKNVHFDTRQYNHIVWDSEDHLAEQLYFFIISLIGKGTKT